MSPLNLDGAEAQLRAVLATDPANVAAREMLAHALPRRAYEFAFPRSFIPAPGDFDPLARAVAMARETEEHQAGGTQAAERRGILLDGLAAAIEQWRVIADELRPTDPAVWLTLAQLHLERAHVLSDAPDAGAAQAALTAVSAERQQVWSWTERVLAEDAGATRLQRLDAWSLRLNALEAEWRGREIAADAAGVERIRAEVATTLAAALAFADAAPSADAPETAPLHALYGTIEWMSREFAGDEATAAAAGAKRAELEQTFDPLAHDHAGEWLHQRTRCAEERVRWTGDMQWPPPEEQWGGDFSAAIAQYEKALAINPTHSSTLVNLSMALFYQGDVDAAIARAEEGTRAAPGWWAFWPLLGEMHLVAGDEAASAAAFDRFFALLEAEPAAERAWEFGWTINDLRGLVRNHPDAAPRVLPVVARFAAALHAMAAEGEGLYWYADLHARLGAVALHADDPAAAEPLLRRALDLEPHQPAARADLALAVLAQGRDATPEIEAAIAKTRDPFWDQIPPVDTPEDAPPMPGEPPPPIAPLLLDRMDAAVQHYLDRFPDRLATVAPLVEAIAADRQRLASASPPFAPETPRSEPLPSPPILG